MTRISRVLNFFEGFGMDLCLITPLIHGNGLHNQSPTVSQEECNSCRVPVDPPLNGKVITCGKPSFSTATPSFPFNVFFLVDTDEDLFPIDFVLYGDKATTCVENWFKRCRWRRRREVMMFRRGVYWLKWWHEQFLWMRKFVFVIFCGHLVFFFVVIFVFFFFWWKVKWFYLFFFFFYSESISCFTVQLFLWTWTLFSRIVGEEVFRQRLNFQQGVPVAYVFGEVVQSRRAYLDLKLILHRDGDDGSACSTSPEGRNPWLSMSSGKNSFAGSFSSKFDGTSLIFFSSIDVKCYC